MIHKTAVMNLPAVYSVQAYRPFSFLQSYVSTWLACYEDKTISICLTRGEAEDACRIHALCEEAQAEHA